MSLSEATSAEGPKSWLLLSVGEDRQHGGNDGYNDDPALTYRWDSRTPDIAPR